MFIRAMVWLSSFILLSFGSIVLAQSGDLFAITTSGTVGSVQVRLCINGKGPTSCENHTVTNFTLSINTTIANRSYPQIGIETLTPGYSFTGCTLYSNGYCIFSASDTSAAIVTINASSDIVSLTNINPSSGTASGMTGVTLTGTNLTGATAVTFGGIAATAVNVVNATTVTATTPVHAAGSVDVVITTPNGSSTLAGGYTYNATAVGQTSGGGIIACLNGGLNNLIAASADNSEAIMWGQSLLANATSQTDGATNTATIVAAFGAGTGYSAGLCDAYEVDSQGNAPCQAGNTCYSDWFLPAVTQMECIYTNRNSIGVDGFIPGNYWTSTENNGLNAWYVSMDDGSSAAVLKVGIVPIRCVRAFTP